MTRPIWANECEVRPHRLPASVHRRLLDVVWTTAVFACGISADRHDWWATVALVGLAATVQAVR